jgi:hypothetical protein
MMAGVFRRARDALFSQVGGLALQCKCGHNPTTKHAQPEHQQAALSSAARQTERRFGMTATVLLRLSIMNEDSQ